MWIRSIHSIIKTNKECCEWCWGVSHVLVCSFALSSLSPHHIHTQLQLSLSIYTLYLRYLIFRCNSTTSDCAFALLQKKRDSKDRRLVLPRTSWLRSLLLITKKIHNSIKIFQSISNIVTASVPFFGVIHVFFADFGLILQKQPPSAFIPLKKHDNLLNIKQSQIFSFFQ